MNLKKLIISSLLLAIGLILHQVSPPLFLGMRPDFLLAMMFIALYITKDYKSSLIIGIIAGFLTAATTTFPGGQIPNIIDKIVTAHVLYVFFKATENKLNCQIIMATASILGTLVSGCVFLGSALILFSLPAPFSTLFLTVVLPACAINIAATLILFKAVNTALKRRSAI
ncbi:tryptophan transporter [Haloimpatiens lingqiaonensis]|uniref:tryptophan transporter n=1 Tax=Haloimpatiens lingqiaonensis TaxID=1380675 RepID=UPI0010FDC8E9|nr:tryptophan transporter [Haloimpatiens lingqiaonensis]